MINNIKNFRNSKSIQQKELAQRCGVTRQTIISIEKNKYSPSFLLVAKISHILEIPIEKLLILEEEDWND